MSYKARKRNEKRKETKLRDIFYRFIKRSNKEIMEENNENN